MASEVFSHAAAAVFIVYGMLVWLPFDSLRQTDGLYSVCFACGVIASLIETSVFDFKEVRQ